MSVSDQMQLLFVSSESTFTYFEATRGYLERYGKPLAFYSDKASVFRINNKNAKTPADKKKTKKPPPVATAIPSFKIPDGAI